MQFLATNVLTLDDWIVTVDFAEGRRVVKGCSPKVDREDAIKNVMRFIHPSDHDKVCSIKAVRRRDSLAAQSHPEIARRLQG